MNEKRKGKEKKEENVYKRIREGGIMEWKKDEGKGSERRKRHITRTGREETKNK